MNCPLNLPSHWFIWEENRLGECTFAQANMGVAFPLILCRQWWNWPCFTSSANLSSPTVHFSVSPPQFFLPSVFVKLLHLEKNLTFDSLLYWRHYINWDRRHIRRPPEGCLHEQLAYNQSQATQRKQ